MNIKNGFQNVDRRKSIVSIVILNAKFIAILLVWLWMKVLQKGSSRSIPRLWNQAWELFMDESKVEYRGCGTKVGEKAKCINAFWLQSCQIQKSTDRLLHTTDDGASYDTVTLTYHIEAQSLYEDAFKTISKNSSGLLNFWKLPQKQKNEFVFLSYLLFGIKNKSAAIQFYFEIYCPLAHRWKSMLLQGFDFTFVSSFGSIKNL